jgi:hypothetical protein
MHHNYGGNHGHHDCQVACAVGRIQQHSNVDHCIGYHVRGMVLCDRDNAAEWLHKAFARGSLHVQTSVVCC